MPRESGRQCLVKQPVKLSKIVADELRQDWIKKNVYPMHEKSVAKKVKEDYDQFNSMRKYEQFETKGKSDEWYKSAVEFNDRLTKHAYYIRTNDVEYQKRLEEECKVKMTKEDEDLCKDNCFGTYKAICTTTVPKKWTMQKKRKDKRERSAEKKKTATESRQLTEQ